MKKTKLTTVVGLLAASTLVYFNVRHALNDYGIRDNEKLHPEIMAQAGTTNGNGSGSGSGNKSAGVETDKTNDCDLSVCDVKTYNRNEKEQYVPLDVKYNAKGGAYATIGTRTVTLGVGATVSGKVGIPDCVRSDCNCCDKKFIENKPKYY